MDATAKSRPGDSRRLGVATWTEAALELLADTGIDGVRVELLAKRLEVTKGSFYWHFKDRDALLDSMLSYWRRRATLSLIERLDRDETSPEARLRLLLRLPLVGRRSVWGANVELAIRLWGRRDPRARSALEEVDELRLRYMSGLFQAVGWDTAEAQARAVIGYSYLRIAATLTSPDDSKALELCEAILVGTPGPRS